MKSVEPKVTAMDAFSTTTCPSPLLLRVPVGLTLASETQFSSHQHPRGLTLGSARKPRLALASRPGTTLVVGITKPEGEHIDSITAIKRNLLSTLLILYHATRTPKDHTISSFTDRGYPHQRFAHVGNLKRKGLRLRHLPPCMPVYVAAPSSSTCACLRWCTFGLVCFLQMVQ